MKDSYYLKQVWAEAIENFTVGAMKSLGMVSEKDRELLAKKIKDAVFYYLINIFNINKTTIPIAQAIVLATE